MGDTIKAALERELTLKKLHVRQGKTGMLDYFFEDYLRISETRDISFLDWVESDYDPVDVKSRFMDQWSGNPITEILKRE